MNQCFESAVCTDVGRVRRTNEDSCLCLPAAGVFCIADGMGGASDGDVASQAIVAQVRQFFGADPIQLQKTLDASAAGIVEAANTASRWIRQYAEERQLRQVGSTLVALALDPANPSRATVLHAGDSRLYRWRAGVLALLTSDHTVMAALVEKSGRDAASIPARYHSELARAVGLKDTVCLDRRDLEVCSSDVFLLCSDGLSRMLSDAIIAGLIDEGQQMDLPTLAHQLIDEANQAGGRDNVSVILVRRQGPLLGTGRLD